MAKLPRISARDMVSVLERRGYVLSRQDGSHKIYKNEEGKRATVPFHASKILHPKVIKSILKDIGMSVDELRSFL